MPESIVLLLSGDLPDRLIDDKTQALMDLLREAEIDARRATTSRDAGQRGGEWLEIGQLLASIDAAELGKFALGVVGGWTGEKLIDLLCDRYLRRERDITITIVRPDGTKIVLSGTQMDRAKAKEFLAALNDRQD